ncbi:hypothetical protein TCAL_14396 [Tigriopus californicus]|uniref:DUF4706 domain-containing protein n=1 Tax=Tigriopus californicus TaxID=6832 RepID=A0A553PL91_TIGCA|nr:hypothetical protein TCAL_14396 [Tigriopus californicus]
MYIRLYVAVFVKRQTLLNEATIPQRIQAQYAGVHPQPLPLHAHSVYPRLKFPTGLKTLTIEDSTGSTGEDLDSASSSCTYTFQDEHSAPFSWRTKSQQDLRFESGTPVSMNSDELQENGLVTLTNSPSKILSMQSQNMLRYSKGNPVFAKPVQIPVVPMLPKPDKPLRLANENVPPEQINNFVYENDANKLVLDFGEVDLNGESIYGTTGEYANSTCSMRTSSPDSTKSSRSLISKMKRTLGPTLSRTRRKSSTQGDMEPQSKASTSSLTTTSSSTMSCNGSSSGTEPIYENPARLLKIVKPSVAPPPPPPSTAKAEMAVRSDDVRPKSPHRVSDVQIAPDFSQSPGNQVVPVKCPPRPPERRESLERDAVANQRNGSDEPITKDTRDSGDLEDFKIDLHTNSDLPKTGFDFLDNW